MNFWKNREKRQIWDVWTKFGCTESDFCFPFGVFPCFKIHDFITEAMSLLDGGAVLHGRTPYTPSKNQYFLWMDHWIILPFPHEFTLLRRRCVHVGGTLLWRPVQIMPSRSVAWQHPLPVTGPVEFGVSAAGTSSIQWMCWMSLILGGSSQDL